MGVRRYSKDGRVAAWQRRFDQLQQECDLYDAAPTIGELLDHGIMRGQWYCRSIGWKPDGKPECYHRGKPFDLTSFNRGFYIHDLRRRVQRCPVCGRDRPYIELVPPE